MPDVSVVIPTRSRWRLLAGAALPSALEQREVDHEVIVVDDGSEDDTAERLASIADPRLRIIRHERPHGVARARNAGIEAARGAWVSFLDDDDVWSPNKLRAQLDAASAAGGDFAYSAGAGLDADRKYLFAVAPPDPATIASRLLRWNVIWCGCSNVAARTALVRELGGFDEQLFQLADWDLWIRLALAGRAAAVPEVHVGYVMHADNMLLTHRRDVFPEFEHLAQKHAEASRAYGIAFDGGLFAHWVARGHRLAGRNREAAQVYLRSARRHRDPGAALRALVALLPEPAIRLGSRLTLAERRSSLRKLAVPEPDWIGRFQP